MMMLTPLIRLITAALFTAVLAGTWDVWWHGAMGRETFWSPPHLLLYASVIVAIVTGFYGWWKTREQSWKWLALVLFLIPASAPFDELWHRIFGIEPANSPLIVWSPPHVILILALVGSFFFLFSKLRQDPDPLLKWLFQSIALASALSLLLFLAAPLEPIGPYSIVGYWGAGIGSGMTALLFLLGQRWIHPAGGATSVAIIFLLISAMNFGEELSPIVNITPHDHPPSWLMIFSCLIPAALMDTFYYRSAALRGGLFGVIHGALLYGFSVRFFEPQFQYSIQNMWMAIVASFVAGVLAGAFLTLISRHRSFSPFTV